jgi:hypothetical protein
MPKRLQKKTSIQLSQSLTKLMAMERPTLFCLNPSCGIQILFYNSIKRKYCTAPCKNQHGHYLRSKKNAKAIDFAKGMKVNNDLLNSFKIAGIYRLNLSMMEKLGFKSIYLPNKSLIKINYQNIECFNLNDVSFYFDNNTTEIVIIK